MSSQVKDGVVVPGQIHAGCVNMTAWRPGRVRRCAGPVYRWRSSWLVCLMGKGCLYIKRLDDVDRDALRELIDRSVRVRKGIDRAST